MTYATSVSIGKQAVRANDENALPLVPDVWCSGLSRGVSNFALEEIEELAGCNVFVGRHVSYE